MTGFGDGRGPVAARSCAKIAGQTVGPKVATLLAAMCVTSVLGGCSSSERVPWIGKSISNLVSPKWGVSASPRKVSVSPTHAGPLPKGGGVRKIGKPYKIAGRWYRPHEDPNYDRVGIASWYGADFHGRLTANGETYDMNALTAAHKTLPLPSYAYVTNLSNNRTVLVRINDRGPYAGNRIIDLSRATARALGLERAGLGKVRVQFAGPAPLDGNDYHERQFLAQRTQRPQSIASVARRAPQSRPHYETRQQSYTRSASTWDPRQYRRSLGR